MSTASYSLQTSQRPLTIEDFESFPDDGNRYEIIGGLLSVSPSPTLEHQRIVGRIFTTLERYFEQTGTGEVFVAPVDVELSNFDVVQPDVAVVLNTNASVKQELRIVGAPDVVVEVISPSSAMRDRVRKAALYAMNSVQEYWLVDPASDSFDMLALQRPGYIALAQPAGLVRSRALEGFEIDLTRLFRRPPE